MSEPPAVLNARGQHSATLIFFHGLGDQGHGWAEAFSDPHIRANHVKYIFPHAAPRPVTLNMGMRMPAWYDLLGLGPDVEEDDAGIEEAKNLVHRLIDAEVAAGIPANRIILGGFSMGAALALWAAQTYPHKLAGCIVLSGFLLQRDKLPAAASANNRDVSVLMGHGSADPLVPLLIGRLTEQKLKSWNNNVQLRVYQGLGHSSSDQEMRDVAAFVTEKAPSP